MPNEDNIPRPSFWAGDHPLAAKSDALQKKLVPPSGRARTFDGELLRCTARLYHDCYNNGFGNLDVPGVQYALLYVYEWREEIAKIAPPGFEGLVGIFRPLHQNVVRRTSLRTTLEDAAWLAQFELLMEAVVLLVASRDECGGA